ncbi:hypothetical protein BDN70DRAFT_993093 [Pholiota conissans]|uniref:HNH nuclease domain-containing protein n=1 Tax=Pholiota conissans TaxID=109636 RepID=A0A9P5Z1X2_9AGAR|nr:hypothetical protein BDN70DRAFT_993093 [Pholiota conissans]
MALTASPLPFLEDVHLDADGISAWKLLLDAEKESLDTSRSVSLKYNNKLIGVRVLGFFLKDFWDHQNHHSFGIVPYKRLLCEIISCNCVDAVSPRARMDKVFKLGLFYRNHLMRVIRSNSGPLQTPSRRTSPPSWDQVRADTIKDMTKAPATKKGAKKQALCRDGYRCMISGFYDQQSFTDLTKEQRDEISAQGNLNLIPTEVVYLFSEPAQDVNEHPEYAASAFTILKLFGIDQTKFMGGLVNDLSHVLTISVHLRQLFDNFTFWLESIPQQPNVYSACFKDIDVYNSMGVLRPPKTVKFKIDPALVAEWNTNPPKDEQGTIIPLPSLPDPNLIAIRAACARVAHLSGAAEQAEQILEDLEDTHVMAADGTTASLLDSLLLRHCSAVS